MPNTKNALDFFSAIIDGDSKAVGKILAGQPIKKVLKYKIRPKYAKIKLFLKSSLPILSKKLTYGEIALELAINANQTEIVKQLIAAGCKVHSRHLSKLLQHFSKSYQTHQIKDLLNSLMTNGIDINAELRKAVLTDDATVVEDICTLAWNCIDQFKEEKSSYDFLQFAVKHHALNVIKTLFQNFENTMRICHREKKSLLDLAKKLGREKIVKFLASQFLHEKEISYRNLTIPLLPLELDDFVIGNFVKPKGLALLLEYYHAKKLQPNKDSKIFFAIGVDTLINSLKLFIESAESELTLLFSSIYGDGSMGSHRFVFRLEKYNQKIFIIIMDSYNTEKSGQLDLFNPLIQEIKNKLPDQISNIVICENLTNQQTDFSNCSHFSLKNISKLLTTTSLAKEIMDNHIIQQNKYQDLDTIYYRLPARFMNVAQSPDRLQDYIEKNISENLDNIRINKEKKMESLDQYAFHERDKFGIKTPEKILNRNYSAEKKDSKEPEYIKKNLTISYFANKHSQYVIPTLFNKIITSDASTNNKNQQKKLRTVIESRDASYLTIDPKTKELNNIETLATKRQSKH